jgi:hypothetical protein
VASFERPVNNRPQADSLPHSKGRFHTQGVNGVGAHGEPSLAPNLFLTASELTMSAGPFTPKV